MLYCLSQYSKYSLRYGRMTIAEWELYVYVYYCRTYEKAVSGGGRGKKEDMC